MRVFNILGEYHSISNTIKCVSKDINNISRRFIKVSVLPKAQINIVPIFLNTNLFVRVHIFGEGVQNRKFYAASLNEYEKIRSRCCP